MGRLTKENKANYAVHVRDDRAVHVRDDKNAVANGMSSRAIHQTPATVTGDYAGLDDYGLDYGSDDGSDYGLNYGFHVEDGSSGERKR